MGKPGMTPDLDEVRRELRRLVGIICTQVTNSVDSVLLIDIGPLGRGPHQTEHSPEQGWRTLLVDSPWRLQTSSEVLCDWNAENGGKGALSRCISTLVGRAVTKVEVAAPAWDLRIWFSSDVELVVFNDATADREYSWTVLGTNGLEIVAGPHLPPRVQMKGFTSTAGDSPGDSSALGRGK